MNDRHDLQLVITSHIPLVIIESNEEPRVLDLLRELAPQIGLPLYAWSVTEGLHRQAEGYSPQRHNAKPADVLAHIKSSAQPGIYVLRDFHPYLDEPINVRLLKDIALAHDQTRQTLVLLSHQLTLPAELAAHSARFSLRLPDRDGLRRIVQAEAARWAAGRPGQRVKTDPTSLDLLVRNLAGLTEGEARRLARRAIYDDGAITASDLPGVAQAKYELLNKDGILHFEYDTERFSEVGGLERLKAWLMQRRAAFQDQHRVLDAPKGVLLLGVQGCGKSLAAKAVAGLWGIPLLRLDFAALYNKFYGETERNLRHALQAAEAMAPCVLWLDEIEKAIGDDNDGGTSRRVLGSLLTWMAEKKAAVFMVATANDIESLPPELVRKGRLDEIFFVDLPRPAVRATIYGIHLRKRGADPAAFDLAALAQLAEGFSGAEIEQSVVAALYAAQAQGVALAEAHIAAEIRQTRPLSVVMAERIAALRRWAAERTVPAD